MVKEFPGCRQIFLEQNYRSTNAILQAALAVILQGELSHRSTRSIADNDLAKQTRNVSRNRSTRLTLLELPSFFTSPTMEIKKRHSSLKRFNLSQINSRDSSTTRISPFYFVLGIRVYQSNSPCKKRVSLQPSEADTNSSIVQSESEVSSIYRRRVGRLRDLRTSQSQRYPFIPPAHRKPSSHCRSRTNPQRTQTSTRR